MVQIRESFVLLVCVCVCVCRVYKCVVVVGVTCGHWQEVTTKKQSISSRESTFS